MLHRLIENITSCGFREIILVIGHRADEVRRYLFPFPHLIVVENADYSLGLGSSLAAGIQACDPKSKGYALFLADKPLIEMESTLKLLRVFVSSDADAVYPVFESKQGHPVIFSKTLRNELTELAEDRGPKVLLSLPDRKILSVEVESPWVVFDINTSEDYETLLSEHENPQ